MVIGFPFRNNNKMFNFCPVYHTLFYAALDDDDRDNNVIIFTALNFSNLVTSCDCVLNKINSFLPYV